MKTEVHLDVKHDGFENISALPRLPEQPHTPERKLIRRVDYRLLPVLGALYSISQVDRINIANARVAGMDEDLGLNAGYRYNIILLAFFVPRLFCGLPSNILLRKLGSANWLSLIAFAWGALMMGQGFLQNYQALATFRAIQGFVGAGILPACVYLVSCWYVRYEVQKRLAVFYLSSVYIAGLSNILAFALQQMESLAGYRGWRWIFIVEGLIVQMIAVAARFILVDFPDKAHRKGFLSQADADCMGARIQADRGDAEPDILTWTVLGKHLMDLKLWAFALMFMSVTMPAYALAYFTPVIVKDMGFSADKANLLSAPPLLLAVLSALFFAWLGDRLRTRAPVIAAQCLLCITGLITVAFHRSNGIRYFGIFLCNAGCQGNIPAVLAYQANNIRHQSKRSVGSALQTGFQAIGGIMAATTFRQVDAPRYLPGLWATAGLQLALLALLGTMTLSFWRANRGMGMGKPPIEGLAGFKYTL